jgi:hypothetical protein
MTLGNTIIRRIDNSNIVVHQFKGFMKDGTTYRMDEPVTYHGTVESALRRHRNDQRARVLKGDESIDDVIKKFHEIDKKFIQMLKEEENLKDLWQLMETTIPELPEPIVRKEVA